jgi:hypothetical protein
MKKHKNQTKKGILKDPNEQKDNGIHQKKKGRQLTPHTYSKKMQSLKITDDLTTEK